VKASGDTGRVLAPVSWVGRRVAVILLDPPDDPSFENRHI